MNAIYCPTWLPISFSNPVTWPKQTTRDWIDGALRRFVYITLVALIFAGTARKVDAKEKVLLDFTGAGANDAEEQGTRGPFQNSPTVGRAARAAAGAPAIGPLTIEQQAAVDAAIDMMMNDIKTQMEAAYAGKWIEFVVKKKAGDAVPGGITRTIDFVSGVDDTAVPGSFGFFNGDKAWVLVDNFNGNVWIPANNVGGAAKAEADRQLDKAELTRAIAKTTAHELGHVYLGAGHPPSTSIQKAPEADARGKGLVLDPAKSSIMSQGFNIFDLGAGGGKLAFSAANMKRIEKLIGTSEANGHKPGRKKKSAKEGDRDALGTETGSRDSVFNPSIDPGILPAGTSGTDVLLPDGVHTFNLTFDQIVGGVDAAFLEIGLYGVNTVLNPGSVELSLAGIPLIGALDSFDTTPSPIDPNPVGSQVLNLVLDLENIVSFGGLAGLTGLFNDAANLVSVPLEISIAGGFGGTIAVDFAELEVFMVPEPATAILLACCLPLLAFNRRRWRK